MEVRKKFVWTTMVLVGLAAAIVVRQGLLSVR